MKRDSVIVSGKQFVCRSLLLVKGKKIQPYKSISFALNIFIMAIVLNSARSDLISFCELVSSGPPVLTNFH